jgi:hypothetical protein
MKRSDKLSSLLKNEKRHEAAVALEAELKLELSDEQRDMLMKFVETNGRFPSAIEMNIESNVEGRIQRSTLFPVTVLVGAMA